MTREFHPAANIFPMLSDDELQVLAGDIKANGLRVPIEFLGGKIIDGRNRYRACKIAGVTPRVVTVYPADPVAYVLSRNLHRRHLNESQRAMVAARARQYYDQQAKARQEATQIKDGRAPVVATLPPPSREAKNRDFGKSRDQAGKTVGVGGRTVDKATKVLAEASAETVKAVDEGKLTVTEAVRKIDQVKAPEPMKDADGRVIPEHLRAIFAKIGDFKRFAQTLSTLKGQVRQAVGTDPVAWSRFSENKFQSLMQQAHDLLTLSGPYVVCSYCGADGSENCTACKGTGFLTKAQARCVPAEMRPQKESV